MCYGDHLGFNGHISIGSISRIVPAVSIMPFGIKNESDRIKEALITFREMKSKPIDCNGVKISYKIGGGLEMLQEKMKKRVVHTSSVSMACNQIESKLMLIRFYSDEKKYYKGKSFAQWLPWDSASGLFHNGRVYPRYKIDSVDVQLKLTKKTIIQMYILPGEKIDLSFEVFKVDDLSNKKFTDWLKEKK